MKQDYFEDKLKDMLETGQEQPFEIDQWRQLRRRLDDAESYRLPWWQRWLPLGMLALLAVLAWQSWQQASLRQEIQMLRESVVLSVDTLRTEEVLHQTTVLYDTVYRHIIKEAKKPSRVQGGRTNEVFSLSSFTTPTFSPEMTGSRGGSGVTRPFAPHQRHTSLMQYRQEQAKALAPAFAPPEEKKDWAMTLLPANLPSLLEVPSRPFVFHLAPADAPTPWSGVPLWQRIRPQAYTLEAAIGSYRTWELAEEESVSLEMGVAASWGKRFSLHLGVGYLQRYFNYAEDELPVGSLEPGPPATPGDELEAINGDLNYLQVPLGLRWQAWQSRDLNLFLEAGVGAAIGVNDNISTVYEASDETSYTLENLQPLPRSLRPNFYYGRAGLGYRFGQRLLGQVSLVQQRGLGRFEFSYQRPELLRWQVGFGYRL